MGPSGSAGADRRLAAAISGPLRRTDAFSSAFEAAAPAGRPGKDPPSSSPGGSFLLLWRARQEQHRVRGTSMNMRKSVAAAFGAALLGAGTAAVGSPAHGVTGGVTSSQKAN